MNIEFNLAHPAHIHYFKNLIRILKKNGHKVLITAVDKEILFDLLNKYDIDYINVGRYSNSLIKKLIDILLIDLRVYKASRSFRPDIFVGFGSISAAHVSFLMGKKCITFEDSEHAREIMMLYLPFADTICTASSFALDLGDKQIRYNGQLEMAYLHPKYFKPNPGVLNGLGLDENEPIILLRLVSWTASHDLGQHGIRNRKKFVEDLQNFGRVLISSEGKLEDELERYRLKISPETVHDLLYFSTIYIGEGATMASEAAILGTHSILISTLAKHCGVFTELNKYDLLWFYDDEVGVIEKVREILQNNPRDEGKRKREKLLNDKIDVTEFMYWLIENHPQSHNLIKTNPKVMSKFQPRVDP
jgi:uncharacterized protein